MTYILTNLRNKFFMRKVSILIFMMGLVGLVTSCCTKTDSATVVDEKQVVVDNMLGRRSIRAYKETSVPKEIMDVILNCGINAPNGMNKQPWEIRVVSNEEYLKGISDLQKENMDPNSPHNPFNEPGFRNIFRNAPTVVFIATDSGMCSQVDCGLLAGNMVNTAWAYGIGSCIQMGPIRFMKTDVAKPYVDKLGFSDGYELLMAIGFGYPDESPDAKPRDNSKIQYLFED